MRPARGIRHLGAAEPARHDEREQRPDDGARRVHEQVVDVEHAVRAGVQAPHPRQLRRLDDERDPEAREERDDDAPAAEHAQEEPQRHEQQHVQRELQDGEVGEAARRAQVADEHREIEVDARARVVVRRGHRQQRVRPDREEVDERRGPQREPPERQAAAPAVADGDEGNEQQDAHENPESDRDRGGVDLVSHAPILSAATRRDVRIARRSRWA